MKKLSAIISCLKNLIKKKFINNSKTDISHDCEKLFVLDEKQISQEELSCVKEYLENYKVTTRWQTL